MDEEIGHIKMLMYGESGSGKTTTWATFPAPILVVLCSGGTQPGELRSINTPENRKRIKKFTLEEPEDLEGVIAHVGENPGKYKTIVIDHVTGMYDFLLSKILGHDEIKVQKSWGMATQQQYGQATMQTKDVLRSFLNFEMHTVFIAQERTFGGRDEGISDDLGIQPTIAAALTKSLVGWLNPACDYVVQTFKRPKMVTNKTKIGTKEIVTKVRGKGVEYCMRVEPHDIFMTKFRIPGGIKTDVIIDPSYAKITALLNGEIGSERAE